jgi:Ca2+-binding EF-hand superfamily protein
MKATKLITLGALIGTCSFASAQDKPKRPDAPKREVPAAVLEKFDADKDGKLSPEERKAAREEMKGKGDERKSKMLEKFDKDGDGKLSDDEKAGMKSEMDAKHAAMLEKYDANKDGKLDKDEAKAARDAGEELPPLGHGPSGPGGKGAPGGPPPAPPAE